MGHPLCPVHPKIPWHEIKWGNGNNSRKKTATSFSPGEHDGAIDDAEPEGATYYDATDDGTAHADAGGLARTYWIRPYK